MMCMCITIHMFGLRMSTMYINIHIMMIIIILSIIVIMMVSLNTRWVVTRIVYYDVYQ